MVIYLKIIIFTITLYWKKLLYLRFFIKIVLIFVLNNCEKKKFICFHPNYCIFLKNIFLIKIHDSGPWLIISHIFM